MPMLHWPPRLPLRFRDIPFAGPISEVRVSRVNGDTKSILLVPKWKLPILKLSLPLPWTMSSWWKEKRTRCLKKELVEAIKVGHDAIKTQIQAQLELAEKVGDKANKREVEAPEEDEALKADVDSFARAKILEIAKGALDKKARSEGFSELHDAVIDHLTEARGEEYMEEKGELATKYYGKLKKEVIREMVLSDKIRLDGRKPNEVRDIWTEVDYLPSAHGSSIFTRGETQALTSVTLGTKMDKMMLDNALLVRYERFILHYNFPGYSVGEVKPMRGPGRREVGHANLAGRSLRKVLPEDMSYTIRIVSDIMESNGSSSMATVCAGSLAMMDAGLQVTNPVSGIAMGLISDGERTVVLSDILGDEDALGDMDFKVTGTPNGITACQMDIKIEGLSYELLEEALEQAKEGRLHILDRMAESLSEPREDLKPHAPRVVEILIDKSFIGALIGPGGKVIQEMQEATGTIINIEEVDDKGVVNIASSNKASIDAALAKIRKITFTPTVGDVYEAVVKSVMPYGVFVEFNGRSGLLHVSEISHSRIDKVEDVFQEGDEVKVKLIGVDSKTGKLRLSRKALIQRPQRNGNRDDSHDGNSGRDNRNRD
jgi:polyribonucleotide nucleotidyltransferase